MVQQHSTSRISLPPRQKLWAVVVGTIILLLAVFWGTAALLRSQMAKSDYLAETTVREIVVGNDVVRVPTNHVRFFERINPTAVKQLELVFLWPEGTGYQVENHDAFLDTTDQRKLLFVTLQKRETTLDMTDRFNSIYRSLLDGEPQKGPSGLIVQGLKDGAGYDREVLVFDKQDQPSYVARCQIQTDEHAVPICLRDVFAGRQLSALYRFPLPLLSQWEAIEQLIDQKLSQMVVK